MAMTRRNFLQAIWAALSAGLGGIWLLAKKAVPRRFTRAVKCKKYPGPVKKSHDTDKIAKWSG
jgi:hypothetical protein